MSIIKHVTLQKIVAHDFRYDPRTRGLWNRATLPIGDPLGNLEEGSITRDFLLGPRGCQESMSVGNLEVHKRNRVPMS